MIHQKSSVAAKLSLISYIWDKSYGNKLKNLGFLKTKTQMIHNGNTHCLVVENKKEIWFVFRGSDSSKDILSNLTFKKSKDNWQIHDGFISRLNDVQSEIDDIISKTNKEIHFAGHSLGGALANIAASRCKKNSTVFSFGSPRVGSFIFLSKTKHFTHYRHKTNMDLVTLIPPFFLGFVHTGQEVYFDHDGKHVETPSIALRLLSSVINIFLKRQILKQHNIKYYISIIERNLNRL
jgi:hypothetical protein